MSAVPLLNLAPEFFMIAAVIVAAVVWVLMRPIREGVPQALALDLTKSLTRLLESRTGELEPLEAAPESTAARVEVEREVQGVSIGVRY